VNFTCNTIADLQPAAKSLLNNFPGSRIFAFYGTMGAGKTTFIQAICRELGIADHVLSPSFAIINEYQTPKGDSVYHFDFYRIRKKEEIFDIGYEEYLFSGSYCFIEWPELMEDLLPEDVVKVMITQTGTGEEREIGFNGVDVASYSGG
jgi:tRNA threonylcarbamoyladenosine biosynthesis protein TsaE